MAEQDSTTKEKLIEINKNLDEILKAREILYTLYSWAAQSDHETITLATDTVFTITCMLDLSVDSIKGDLKNIFQSGPQAAAEGGQHE